MVFVTIGVIATYFGGGQSVDQVISILFLMVQLGTAYLGLGTRGALLFLCPILYLLLEAIISTLPLWGFFPSFGLGVGILTAYDFSLFDFTTSIKNGGRFSIMLGPFSLFERLVKRIWQTNREQTPLFILHLGFILIVLVVIPFVAYEIGLRDVWLQISVSLIGLAYLAVSRQQSYKGRISD